MLVVEAREIGRGRLLAVEPDVLDRGRIGPGAILVHSSCLKNGTLLSLYQHGELGKHWGRMSAPVYD